MVKKVNIKSKYIFLGDRSIDSISFLVKIDISKDVYEHIIEHIIAKYRYDKWYKVDQSAYVDELDGSYKNYLKVRYNLYKNIKIYDNKEDFLKDWFTTLLKLD